MAELMLVMLLGLVGPLLAIPRRFGVPVAVGELLAGVVFGASGLKVIDASAPNLALLGQIGFALVMMVTASHIDVKIFASRNSGKALRGALIVGVGATALAAAICTVAQNYSNLGLIAVVMASSSAAVVLPLFTQASSAGENSKNSRLPLFVAQVAIADVLAVVLLPLVSHDGKFFNVLGGATAITVSAGVIFGLLYWLQKSGRWKRMRKYSASNRLGLELRISFILLLALVNLAQNFQVTIMIAGFGLGLAIAANGMPRRLAKQLFAVSEGFFSPIFFVLLGASIDIGAVLQSPRLLGLALVLGFGAIAVHLFSMLNGLPFALAVASSAQLGVPAAAVSIGLASHSLSKGEAGAIMLGALITLAATAIAAAAKAGKTKAV